MLSRAIILVGLPGSGKTEGATYLKGFGFVSISAGDVVRELCRKEGLPTTRESLSAYGRQLLATDGFEYFGGMLLKRAIQYERVIFEGIRPPEVIRWLKTQLTETVVIYIEAPEEVRLSRLEARGEDKHSHKLVMTSLMENAIVQYKPLADVVIENTGTLDEFRQSLKDIALHFLRR